ncbi:hypothetical protein [Pseudomonas putida]|uniref:hypothetical protein n=1 Tax=Pseudomonas putida TaxID=303 RepID=UPI001575E4C4|nr:hypothetical protein [Pseudomonas putida]NTY90423.1 hypothetical protein [Pseudomonas putida]NTY98965.1 hypothetical protein [Pseudomonas putida]NTZ21248.1 hypothetical protein [Pseudomonas putida]NTZ53233.1 hypothetical protein [Pseudomonas putida]NTZ65117.1 hypothetical protein [Pseudomonas putida]
MEHQPVDRDVSDIEVSAYDPDRKRLTRLHHVLGYAAAMMDVNGIGRLASRVAGVHDHKGILQVHWISVPVDVERHVFKQAWGSQVGDGTDQVEHFRGDVQLL